MTLDEAIQHAEEKAKELEKESVCNKDCAKEHWQLAKWLRELREYKKQNAKSTKSTIALGNSMIENISNRNDSDFLILDDIPNDCNLKAEPTKQTVNMEYRTSLKDYKLKANSNSMEDNNSSLRKSSEVLLFHPITLTGDTIEKIDIGFNANDIQNKLK